MSDHPGIPDLLGATLGRRQWVCGNVICTCQRTWQPVGANAARGLSALRFFLTWIFVIFVFNKIYYEKNKNSISYPIYYFFGK
jgi:hypothetical protein